MSSYVGIASHFRRNLYKTKFFQVSHHDCTPMLSVSSHANLDVTQWFLC